MGPSPAAPSAPPAQVQPVRGAAAHLARALQRRSLPRHPVAVEPNPEPLQAAHVRPAAGGRGGPCDGYGTLAKHRFEARAVRLTVFQWFARCRSLPRAGPGRPRALLPLDRRAHGLAQLCPFASCTRVGARRGVPVRPSVRSSTAAVAAGGPSPPSPRTLSQQRAFQSERLFAVPKHQYVWHPAGARRPRSSASKARDSLLTTVHAMRARLRQRRHWCAGFTPRLCGDRIDDEHIHARGRRWRVVVLVRIRERNSAVGVAALSRCHGGRRAVLRHGLEREYVPRRPRSPDERP